MCLLCVFVSLFGFCFFCVGVRLFWGFVSFVFCFLPCVTLFVFASLLLLCCFVCFVCLLKKSVFCLSCVFGVRVCCDCFVVLVCCAFLVIVYCLVCLLVCCVGWFGALCCEYGLCLLVVGIGLLCEFVVFVYVVGFVSFCLLFPPLVLFPCF